LTRWFDLVAATERRDTRRREQREAEQQGLEILERAIARRPPSVHVQIERAFVVNFERDRRRQ
jgi:hypothetical protein